ncbi:hypothetical protein IAT38_002896 [Cryptococcus sp. DSM 104549]
MSNSPRRERLDVESPQDREARLGQLLSSISEPKQDQQSPQSPPNPIPSRPFAVPESDVLARVRAFLPEFQASNNALLAQAAANPESVNIEKGEGERYIAMDLGLGVFDAPSNPSGDMGPVVDSRPPEGLEAKDEDENEEDESEESSDKSSSSDDSDEESEAGKAGEKQASS